MDGTLRVPTCLNATLSYLICFLLCLHYNLSYNNETMAPGYATHSYSATYRAEIFL
jgi:hypothetical protein